MDYRLIKENFDRSMKEEKMVVRPELGKMAGEMIAKALNKRFARDPMGLFSEMEILVDADFPGGEAWKKALMDELSRDRSFVPPPSDLDTGLGVIALLDDNGLKVQYSVKKAGRTMIQDSFELI